MDIQQIKQRFGIIGDNKSLNRAIYIALQVAHTDLAVLITGESGTGKEVFPKIIHQYSARKHGHYIPVNCGAIPEGTVDSELFGHEKGAFTGAHERRKGYFEEVDNGTIFLDEVSELPLSTQARLLRVLETGEFIKVGSSKVQKTNVRVIAATNVDILEYVNKGKFREDLYYRLNTVPIYVPPLRERKEDIYLLFKKFARDFSERYKIPPIKLTDEAKKILINYRWPGNIRQLKNITEQMSVIEHTRIISPEILKKYISDYIPDKLPAIYRGPSEERKQILEREILYNVLFDMRRDMNELKKLVLDILKYKGQDIELKKESTQIIKKLSKSIEPAELNFYDITPKSDKEQAKELKPKEVDENIQDTEEYIEENLSLQKQEMQLIKRALEKYNGKRKLAAKELGISERTLYRKIKEYNIT